MNHPLRDMLEQIAALLDETTTIRDDGQPDTEPDAEHTAETAAERGVSMSGLGAAGLDADEVRVVMQLAWTVVQRVQGAVLLPMVAETERRRLYRHRDYASASSSRDLIAGWLRCPPATAGRLLKTAKHCTTGAFTRTGTALATGRIDTEHARAVVDSVRRLPIEAVGHDQRIAAEATMLDTAKTTDAEITAAAGQRLLEVIAPDAAAEHADRQAERERLRAESSRWLEITGFGIAGAKELRLRAESNVIDTFAHLLTSLMQPNPTDPEPTTSDTAGPSDTRDTSNTGDMDVADATAATGETGVIGPAGVASVTGLVDPVSGTAELPAGGGPPGTVADIGLALAPIERRRADAAVEVLDAFARPNLVDELTTTELRQLADYLESGDASTSMTDGGITDGSVTGCGVTDGMTGSSANSIADSIIDGTGEHSGNDTLDNEPDGDHVLVETCHGNDAATTPEPSGPSGMAGMANPTEMADPSDMPGRTPSADIATTKAIRSSLIPSRRGASTPAATQRARRADDTAQVRAMPPA